MKCGIYIYVFLQFTHVLPIWTDKAWEHFNEVWNTSTSACTRFITYTFYKLWPLQHFDTRVNHYETCKIKQEMKNNA